MFNWSLIGNDYFSHEMATLLVDAGYELNSENNVKNYSEYLSKMRVFPGEDLKKHKESQLNNKVIVERLYEDEATQSQLFPQVLREAIFTLGRPFESLKVSFSKLIFKRLYRNNVYEFIWPI